MGKDNEKSKSNKKPSGSDKKTTTAASKVKKSSKSTAGGSKVVKSETKSTKSTASKKSTDSKSKNTAKKSSTSSASKKSSTSSKSNKQTAPVKQIKKAKAKPVPKQKPKDEEETAAEEDETQAEPDASSQVGQSSQTSEQSEDGESVEGQENEPEKPKEESLQFTKPTINQIKKDKKEKPLSMSEKITGREFESLNDDITELNGSVQMLKHSYGSIIKSLCAMQDRRAKKRAAKEAKQQELTFLTTLSTADPAKLKTKSCLAQADKYDIERFINPITREETFNALFDEVAELNGRTEALRTNFYDPRGRFLRDKYEAQAEVRLDRAQFNEYKLWTKKLATIIDELARNYNDDLLNMFRLT